MNNNEYNENEKESIPEQYGRESIENGINLIKIIIIIGIAYLILK